MQTVSSMQTSINTTKVPAVWNKLDLKNICANRPNIFVDYGCGRPETQQLIRKKVERYAESYANVRYYGYDPYWGDIQENKEALRLLRHETYPVDVCVCANVLNVIDDEKTIEDIVRDVTHSCFWVFQIYEGNRSGCGKYTKKGTCYQQNKPIQWYADKIEDILGVKIRRKGNLLCNSFAILK